MRTVFMSAILFASTIAICGDDAINEWLAKQPIKVGEKLENDDDFYLKGFTLMHIAAIDGRVDVMKWLKEKGEDINAKSDREEFTPLLVSVCNPRFFAMRKESFLKNIHNLIARDSNIEAAKWLISQGADINAKSRSKELTLIHIAASFGNIEAMKLLKEQGFDLNVKTDDGKILLDFANELLEELHEKLGELHEKLKDLYEEDPEYIQSMEILIKVVIQDIKEGIEWLKANGVVESE